ncbi:DUF2577 domain-containing protein [Heyndrickxia oleronia]|uniref:DUF2577 domain-containing protein n=1 Tax=Heyndrickxia oleronia TaxID=38875 RepID=UPI003753132F
MLDLIKRAAEQVNSNNQPMRMMEAVVLKSPPDLEIKLLGNDKLIIPKDLIVVSERLTRHTRIVTLTHNELATRDLGDKEEVDFLDTDDLVAPLTFYKHSFIEMQFEDVLKVNDRVLVYSFPGFQKFFIADRIISYGDEGDGE